MSSYTDWRPDNYSEYTVWELVRLCVRKYWTKFATHLLSRDFLLVVCGRVRIGHSASEPRRRMWNFGRMRGRTSGTVTDRATPKRYPRRLLDFSVPHQQQPPLGISSLLGSNPFLSQDLPGIANTYVDGSVQSQWQERSKSILAQQASMNQHLSQLLSQSGPSLRNTEASSKSFESPCLTSNHTAYHLS